jgi:hypothetical protein
MAVGRGCESGVTMTHARGRTYCFGTVSLSILRRRELPDGLGCRTADHEAPRKEGRTGAQTSSTPSS